MNESMVFYNSWWEVCKDLPYKEFREVMEILMEYGLNQKEPTSELVGIPKVVWTLAKPQMDANIKKRTAGAKGAAFGRLGGRPKKETNGDIKENPIGVIDINPIGDITETPNANVNVNVNANVNENVNEKENKKSKHKEEIEEVVTYLNKRVGAKYRANSDSTSKHINARLEEGFTVEDFKTVIDKKAAAWLGSPVMAVYLRPNTLFSKEHFEEYLNEAGGATAVIQDNEVLW